MTVTATKAAFLLGFDGVEVKDGFDSRTRYQSHDQKLYLNDRNSMFTPGFS